MKNKKRADGLFQSKVHIGNGKFKYVYAKTNKELEKKVQELKLKLNKGLDLSESETTFEEMAKMFLMQKKLTVSDKKYKVYVNRVDDFESIKKYPIAKIKASDIQCVIYEMSEKGYSEYVLKSAKGTAKQIIQLAIDNRILDYNCANAVKIPKCKPVETRRALTQEEIEWINADSDSRGHRAAMIMLYAGLRRGELIPLLWSDIDFKNATITVNKSVETVNAKFVIKDSTKTKAGMRTVHIPQKLVDFLANEKKTSLYVCPSANGKMMTHDAFRRMWESYLKELNFKFGNFGNLMIKNNDTDKVEAYKKPNSKFAPEKIPFIIERFTPHQLRHTFITMMYFAGIDILTAKEQAGHSNVETTLNIYTHLDNIHKDKQMSKLDEYLAKMG